MFPSTPSWPATHPVQSPESLPWRSQHESVGALKASAQNTGGPRCPSAAMQLDSAGDDASSQRIALPSAFQLLTSVQFRTVGDDDAHWSGAPSLLQNVQKAMSGEDATLLTPLPPYPDEEL